MPPAAVRGRVGDDAAAPLFPFFAAGDAPSPAFTTLPKLARLSVLRRGSWPAAWVTSYWKPKPPKSPPRQPSDDDANAPSVAVSCLSVTTVLVSSIRTCKALRRLSEAGVSLSMLVPTATGKLSPSEIPLKLFSI